jgi:glycosyltransferase involved in cell wall biosynthesis
MKKRLLFIQFAGDYRETVKRFSEGGDETYYAQKYSVDVVAEAGNLVAEVATLCCLTEEYYDEVLENGVRSIGAGFKDKIHTPRLIQLIERYQPTHIVLRAPLRGVIRWSIQHKLKILLTLADSFGLPKLKLPRLKTMFQNYQLSQLLNHKQVDWVGNHGVTASKSLSQIGVDPKKIIPWDWPHLVSPNLFPVKNLPLSQRVWTLAYVGAIQLNKGFGDILTAISTLKHRGFPVQLKAAGGGDIDRFIQKSHELDISECVSFLGSVPNGEVIALMRDADIVLVPSHHEYPEGFPMTIYEALCARTPLVVSDHPMFLDTLMHEVNALIFPAGSAIALSKSIETLLSSPELYARLSEASYETWQRLQLTAKWGDIVYYWLRDTETDRQWLRSCSLASQREAQ